MSEARGLGGAGESEGPSTGVPGEPGDPPGGRALYPGWCAQLKRFLACSLNGLLRGEAAGEAAGVRSSTSTTGATWAVDTRHAHHISTMPGRSSRPFWGALHCWCWEVPPGGEGLRLGISSGFWDPAA